MIRYVVIGILLLAAAAAEAENTSKKTVSGPYTPNWESLDAYECPPWFRDAKFGIYAHWGPYSVPQYKTEWYSHWMYQPNHDIYKHHVKTFGPVSKFGYKDFIPRFTAEKFDADAWADLYKKAGARFAGPVAEHADGFAMWDSALTQWDAKDMGPKRDVVGELEQAIRQRGMKFVSTLHHQWLWGWYATTIEDADVHDPRYKGLYGPDLPVSAFKGRKEPMPDDAFCARWLAKCKEVIDKYRPDLLWFDTKLFTIKEKYRLPMVSYYYNRADQWGKPVVLTYKREDLKEGSATIDIERGRMESIYPRPWLTDTSIARKSWSYTPDLDYYSTTRLVHDLIDIVSKNGCLLLNVAPRADGTIPEEQKTRLLGMGQWLKQNGEAIYGTRPWRKFGEGPTNVPGGHFGDLKFEGFTDKDIRFTTKGDTLFAIAMGWPAKELAIRSLGKKEEPKEVSKVRLIGHETDLTWQRNEEALIIPLPETKPCEHAYVFAVDFE